MTKSTNALLAASGGVTVVILASIFILVLQGDTNPLENNRLIATNGNSPANEDIRTDGDVSTNRFEMNLGSRSASGSNFSVVFDDIYNVAKHDLRAAFWMIDGITPKSYQAKLRFSLAQRVISADFSRLSEVLNMINDRSERHSVLADVVQEAVTRDSKHSISIIQSSLKGDMLSEGLRFAVSAQLAAGTLNEAISTHLAMPFGNARSLALGGVADSVAKTKDFSQILSWLGQLNPEGERSKGVSWIQESLISARNYEALEQLLQITPSGRDRESLIRFIASGMIERGADDVTTFANSLAENEKPLVILSQLASDNQMTFVNKTGATLRISDPRIKMESLSAIVSKEVDNDPQNAAKLVWSLPENERLAALPPLISRWMNIDTESVSVWIQGLPVGAARDRATSALALNLKFIDRPAAAEVASWIGNARMREEVTADVRR